MSDVLDSIREAQRLIESLPPSRVRRIRFRDKADMVHQLGEPDLRPHVPIDSLFGIPIVFDSDVPYGEYRIDHHL